MNSRFGHVWSIEKQRLTVYLKWCYVCDSERWDWVKMTENVLLVITSSCEVAEKFIGVNLKNSIVFKDKDKFYSWNKICLTRL